MRLAVLAACFFALAACSQQPAPPKPHGDQLPPAVGPAPIAPLADSPAAPFSVNLTFSPKAAAKLAGMKEQVIVSAMYYGEPQPGFEPKEAGDVGVDLGGSENTVAPVNGASNFAPSFNAAQLAREVKGAPRVLINVYSARLAHADNLLSCGIYDDAVSAAAAAAPAIACQLIEE